MAGERPLYLGPRLRRLRRELGLTQAGMAGDLNISPSYVALIERNQRPVTADLLVRLARTYRMDVAELAGDGGVDDAARLRDALKDPVFADIDLTALEVADVATNYPGVAEALLRVYTAFREEQLALAERGGQAEGAADPVSEVRRFLAARRNSFPALDDAGERIAAEAAGSDGLADRLKERHGLRVRRLPADVVAGSSRRYDRHRAEVMLSEALDAAGGRFQLATQLAHLELRGELDEALARGDFAGESGRRLARRALAAYAAAAIVMPYAAFARAAEALRYDVEALSRRFGTSFEQAAHRLTTLARPGGGGIPFFLLRVDAAGNVSKRLDAAGFPFARSGGGCPLWSVHHVLRRPGEVVAQWLELPDGRRYFSVARTVTAGGGGFGAARTVRALAIGCAAEHAHRLVYADRTPPEAATPVGVACTLCHRTDCPARALPPIGRQLASDEYRRPTAPFGFSDP